MPIIGGSGTGGSDIFNGGTITSRLTLADNAVPASLSLTPTDDVAGNSVEIMRLVAPAGYLNDNNGYFVQCFDEDGNVSARLAEGGSLLLRSTAQGTADFRVSNLAGSAYLDLSPTGVSQSGSSSGTNFGVDAGGNLTAHNATVAQFASAPAAPATTTFSSGTGKQILTNSDVHLVVPVTFNPTAGAAATCAVAISPDNMTYTALWTETEPAGVTFDGTIHGLHVYVPAAWYVKFTVTNATLGTGTYY